MMKNSNATLAFILTMIGLAFVPSTCSVIKAQNTTPQKPKAELYVQTGHTDRIESIAFSPDGKTLASGSDDKTIKLWNVETGQELRTLTGHAWSFISVKFSPDGKMLASSTEDGKVKVWSVETGHELRTFEEPTHRAPSFSFSPDGKTLAFGSDDKTIKLWNVETGQELRTLTGHTKGVLSVAFSADGKMLASGSKDGTVRLWSMETGQEPRTLKGHTRGVIAVAFSADGKTLASGSEDGTVKVWSMETGHELRTLRERAMWPALSADGKTLASSSFDKTIKLWNVETGQELRTLTGHTDFISSITFSADGKTLASSSFDKTVKLWNVETGQELRTLTRHIANLDWTSFSPDGKTLASGSDDNTIKLWNVETGQELRTLAGQVFTLNSITFSADGKTLASGSDDKTIKLWNVETGQELRTLTGHAVAVSLVRFSPDGKTLASGSEDKAIKLWNVETGQELRTLTGHADDIYSMMFSPNSKTLASSSFDKTVKLWSVETGQELRTLKGHTKGVLSVAFSPDGKTLASGSEDKAIKLWNVETGQELRTLTGHTHVVLSVRFSPDGETLASGSMDNTIKLWSMKTGQLTRSLDRTDPGSIREFQSLMPDQANYLSNLITKDGRFQIRKGNNNKLEVYDFNTGKLLASLITIDKTDWAIVTPDGQFDGSPNAWKLLSWRLSDKLYDIAPVEAFYNEFYRPGLLQDIFAGKQIERPTRDISSIDIRQPEVKVRLAPTNQTAANITEKQVTITVEVKDVPADERRSKTSGAKDVRLFRNGSLVRLWEGDVLKGKETVSMTVTVPIIAGDNTFTAYAFNNDNIKSGDATVTVTGAESLKRKGLAYVLAIGINEYANPAYNLSYSVDDAKAFGEEISQWQGQLGRFERTVVITLLNEQATKKNILTALQQLREKAQPEDAVMIYFAGHGTAEGKRFYLIPHDLGYKGSRSKINTNASGLRTMLRHSISDREFEEAVRGIDAGQMLFVIDACNSGQALEAEEKRRGPMNSAGLAQLAYEKGMYILTASQSYQFANESPILGHGYLTYALVEKGLKSAVADSNKDGVVDVREWFVYATEEVPKIYEEEMKKQSASKLAQLRARKRDSGLAGIDDVQRPRVFYRRELELQPLIVARP